MTLKNKHFQFFTAVLLATSIFAITKGLSASAETTATLCPYVWERNLRIGAAGDDVLKLQQFLNTSADTAIARFGDGSAGKEITRYGSLTAVAVKKFQEKYRSDVLLPSGLSAGNGFVGALTRAKLNGLCSAQVSAVSVSVGSTASTSKETNASNSTSTSTVDTLTIAVPDQPAHTIAPASAGWVPFTSVTLTAGDVDVNIKSITVERVGFGADGAFDSVLLADQDLNQLGLSRSLRSDHKVDLGDSFTIPAKSAKTITVMANMTTNLSSFDGQMPAFQIDAVNVVKSKIIGSLPIRGTYQTVNSSLVIGSATVDLSQFDPSIATTRYINDAGVRFSGIRFTADSKEDQSLSTITWEQTGSAANKDLANVATVINNVSYPATTTGKKFTSNFAPPILLKKGNSIDVYVKGDLLPSGANRTVEFDIRRLDDISLLGNTYGFYVPITPGSATAVSGHSVFLTNDGTTGGSSLSPFFSGSIVSISGGTFTSIGK